MFRRLAVAVAAMVSVASGCVTAPQSDEQLKPLPAVQVEAGREFKLGVGQEARVRGTTVVMLFAGVSEDSRCPKDVQCVWAGNAKLRLRWSGASGGATEVQVNTGVEPRNASYAGYRVRIVAIEPVPVSTRTIPVRDYLATFEFTPNQ